MVEKGDHRPLWDDGEMIANFNGIYEMLKNHHGEIRFKSPPNSLTDVTQGH